VGGKKADARSLSKWLGSLGDHGEPPHEYFIAEAAKELGMSYADLERDPERERYMTIAFTLSQGRSEGEHMMQCNPIFIKKQKKRQGEIERANKRSGKA
jgi:hypothetical protein